MTRAFVVTVEIDDTMPAEQAANVIADAVDNFYTVISVNAWDSPGESGQPSIPRVNFPTL